MDRRTVSSYRRDNFNRCLAVGVLGREGWMDRNTKRYTGVAVKCPCGCGRYVDEHDADNMKETNASHTSIISYVLKKERE